MNDFPTRRFINTRHKTAKSRPSTATYMLRNVRISAKVDPDLLRPDANPTILYHPSFLSYSELVAPFRRRFQAAEPFESFTDKADALFLCVLRNDLDALPALIDDLEMQGALLSELRDEEEQSLLHVAATHGHVEVAKLLLRHCSDLAFTIETRTGRSSLHNTLLACRNPLNVEGCLAVATYLVRHFPETLDIEDFAGQAPLDCAPPEAMRAIRPLFLGISTSGRPSPSRDGGGIKL